MKSKLKPKAKSVRIISFDKLNIYRKNQSKFIITQLISDKQPLFKSS